jgi:hypothetical protein
MKDFLMLILLDYLDKVLVLTYHTLFLFLDVQIKYMLNILKDQLHHHNLYLLFKDEINSIFINIILIYLSNIKDKRKEFLNIIYTFIKIICASRSVISK